MVFFDFYNASAAFVQSFFAWGTFNRDAFVQNTSMRQVQKYQKKNYNLSWITIARDDIRDMMSISVNRINNYMIVATLILGVAASAVTSVNFDEETPDYVAYSFYMSIALSIIYLTLTIMFGVKGQNSAFTNTMKLLTYKVRPENPAEYSHYMKQAQHIEALGPTQLFRIPGTKPSYCVEPEWDAAKEAKAAVSQKAVQALPKGWHAAVDPATGRPFYHNVDGRPSQWEKPQAVHESQGQNQTAEEETPLESLFVTSPYLWYFRSLRST